MSVLTIYRNQFPDTFTPPTNSWTTYSGGSNNYPGLPAGYLPFWYAGEAIEVATPGVMSVSGSIGAGDSSPHVDGGAAFYGVGVDDPNGQQIPDDSTWAYDLRDTIHEVSYVHESSAFNTGAENSAFGPILAISKNLSGPQFYLAWYGDGWGADSRKYEIKYKTWTSDPAFIKVKFGSITPDDATHRYKIQVQPGTITGDPDTRFGWSSAFDGFIRIWLDGVLLYEITGIDLVLSNPVSSTNAFTQNPVMARSVWLGFSGIIGAASDLHIYREIPGTIPTDDSSPCCGSSVDPAAGGGSEPGGVGATQPNNPYEALQPWIPACTGGGTVETAADLTDAESWA